MPRTLGPTVLTTAFTLTSVSTVVVGVRFYCRHALLRSVKLYDYSMLLALLLTWGIAVINYYQVHFGTGVRTADQDKSGGTPSLEGTLKTWYTYQIVYLLTLCAVKFSILTFYRVISAQRSYRIAVYVVMAAVGIFTIIMVFVNAFECPNPSDAWSVEILFQGSGSCNDLHPIYYAQAGFNILSDIVILLLPMPALHRLQMRRNKRIALIAIFSAGSVAVIASIIRVYALTIWSSPDADVPYAGANILIWSQIEINVAITSASIPSLKPLFKRTFGGSTAAATSGRPVYLGYDRSYGHPSATHTKQLPSHLETGLESAASIQIVPRRGHPGGVELDDFGKSDAQGLRSREPGKAASTPDSDEEAILSSSGPIPPDYNTHEDLIPPHQNTTGAQYVTNGSPEADLNPGLHIMRSVTIETSVQPKSDDVRDISSARGLHTNANTFHVPRRPGSHRLSGGARGTDVDNG